MHSIFKTIFQKRQLLFFCISMILFLIAFILQALQQNEVVCNTLFCLSFMIGGYYKAKEGVVDFITTRQFNVDLLMVIAAVGSAIIGYFEEGAILIAIFSLSGALEEFVTSKSTSALESLLELAPETAHKIVDNEVVDVDVNTLLINDVVLVLPGERIPVDGIVIEGESTIDQSTITGESIPIFAQEKTSVYTGTLNLSHNIIVKNMTELEDRAVERVVHLIAEAKTKRSRQEQFVSRFNRIYVNAILISSVVIFLSMTFLFHFSINDSFYRTMVFLVVASPCAVVAATIPVTLSAISNGARRGILFKGGDVVEKIADINFLAFDKTGTITKGTPTVTNSYFVEREEELLSLLLTLESQSTHPLAMAISRYIKEKNITGQIITGVEDIPGFGVEATVSEVKYRAGSARFIDETYERTTEILELETQWKNEAKTLVYMSCNEKVVAIIALQDEIRDQVDVTIEQIKQLQIVPNMLTGDNNQTAKYISNLAGIEHYSAECLPETKVEIIEKAKKDGYYTAMVGDGINDGPAIAIAEVGVAMGSGSELTSQTADVVLMQNDLAKIPYAYRLSKKHNHVIRQNIIFALGVIVTLISCNFILGIELPFAVIFHEGSTILVILNGLRLLKEV